MQKFLYRLLTNFLILFGGLCLASIKQVAYRTTITVTGSWVVIVIVLAVGTAVYQQLTGRPQEP